MAEPLPYVTHYSGKSEPRRNTSGAAPPPAIAGRSHATGQSARNSTTDQYDPEELARVCARFITRVFACSRPTVSSTSNPSAPAPSLTSFIAYALRRTQLPSSVVFATLYLLHRLKSLYPQSQSLSGHRLFLSAFILSSKANCDNAYSNKAWVEAGQRIFLLREVNQMERTLYENLQFSVDIHPEALRKFTRKVKEDFGDESQRPSNLSSTTAVVGAGTTLHVRHIHSISTANTASTLSTRSPRIYAGHVPAESAHYPYSYSNSVAMDTSISSARHPRIYVPTSRTRYPYPIVPRSP